MLCQNIYINKLQCKATMQPKGIESVHGYLAPQRILSSLLNSTKKSKINRSLTTQQINYNDPLDQSLGGGTTPRRQRESYKKKGDYNEGFTQKQQQANFILHSEEHNSSQNEKKKSRVSNDNIDFIRVYDEKNGNSSRVSRASLNSKKKQEGNEQQTFNKKQNSQLNNADANSTRRFIVPNKARTQIERLAIQQTLKQLVVVKNSLEQEIGALKSLLDDTSTSLQSMDQEFQIIKEKILTFTSKALDASFRQYKKHLPNWSIYEEVEEKGLNKIAEINQSIEACQSYDKLKSIGGKEVIERALPHYRAAVKQVKQAREECEAQRPIISEQKIKKLENVLRQIGEF